MKSATPKDTYDHMFGSGATQYEWWLSVKAGPGMDLAAEPIPNDWSIIVTIDDGNDGIKSREVTHAVVMRAARQFMNKKPQYSSDSAREACKDLVFNADECDFDAASADELLQFILLDEIVYG